MHRLPTQFDTQAARRTESAAAGGSTSTTCSSCIVTLGTTAVLGSMYFSALGKDEVPAPATPEAPAPASKTPWGRIGFFLPLIALVVSGVLGGVFSGASGVGLVVGGFFAVIAWVGAYAWLHQRTGRSVAGGVLAGVIALALFCGGVVLEVLGWLKAL